MREPFHWLVPVFFCLIHSHTLIAGEPGFTADQVERGRTIYREHCQICHGSTLVNGQFGTPLRGSFFRGNWQGKSLGELVRYTYETMPPDNVMMLAPAEYAEVTAFILEANGLQPGNGPMPGDMDLLDEIPLPW